MRFVLIILLASTVALLMIALLVRPEAPRSALATQMRQAGVGPALPRLPTEAGRTGSERGTSGRLASASPTTPPGFTLPLTERTLPASRRAEAMEPEMREAFERIEPVIDPTRLEGPFAPPVFRIWPGTASLADVFGEHWRLASDDANVQLPTHPYALGWNGAASPGCGDFVKNRAHAAGVAALSGLSETDCREVRRRLTMRRDAAAPVPITAAAVSLAVFAAPPPGARMSSRDFWVLQKDRIEAARLTLQRRLQAVRAPTGDLGLRD